MIQCFACHDALLPVFQKSSFFPNGNSGLGVVAGHNDRTHAGFVCGKNLGTGGRTQGILKSYQPDQNKMMEKFVRGMAVRLFSIQKTASKQKNPSTVLCQTYHFVLPGFPSLLGEWMNFSTTPYAC